MRLLPKDSGVRPIVNLRRRKAIQRVSCSRFFPIIFIWFVLQHGLSAEQSINQILQAAFQILSYEKVCLMIHSIPPVWPPITAASTTPAGCFCIFSGWCLFEAQRLQIAPTSSTWRKNVRQSYLNSPTWSHLCQSSTLFCQGWCPSLFRHHRTNQAVGNTPRPCFWGTSSSFWTGFLESWPCNRMSIWHSVMDRCRWRLGVSNILLWREHCRKVLNPSEILVFL